MMTRILILAGGISDEREVSLRSGKAVYDALANNRKFLVTLIDYNGLFEPSLFKDYDVVFSVLHGRGGEDGSLQAQLELLDVTFVGTDAQASSLCFDKIQYKSFLMSHDLPTPGGEIVDVDSFWTSEYISSPFVLKPNDGGSSIDTLLVHDTSLIDKSVVKDLFSRHDTMLVEMLIEGDEITVAVINDQALPVIEIIPPGEAEFDYENKYNGKTQELCPPKNVSQELQTKSQILAEEIHILCGCRDYSRTDMIIRGQEIWVLETNTLPGMTTQSLLPKAAATVGINMASLTSLLVEAACQRQ
ncbi:MAG: ddl [Candidatus Saccharibacteria bacterium]|nr:ddl [Candidatus Saccharibacteria bacterium]